MKRDASKHSGRIKGNSRRDIRQISDSRRRGIAIWNQRILTTQDTLTQPKVCSFKEALLAGASFWENNSYIDLGSSYALVWRSEII